MMVLEIRTVALCASNSLVIIHKAAGCDYTRVAWSCALDESNNYIRQMFEFDLHP